jgi:hypothetical protein
MNDTVTCTAELKSFSSGLKKITIEGSSMAVVSAMRAIIEKEGTGAPAVLEARQTITMCDSGPRSASVYLAVAPLHREKVPRGRHVTLSSAHRFGIEALQELGFVVEGAE